MLPEDFRIVPVAASLHSLSCRPLELNSPENNQLVSRTLVFSGLWIEIRLLDMQTFALAYMALLTNDGAAPLCNLKMLRQRPAS